MSLFSVDTVMDELEEVLVVRIPFYRVPELHR